MRMSMNFGFSLGRSHFDWIFDMSEDTCLKNNTSQSHLFDIKNMKYLQ